MNEAMEKKILEWFAKTGYPLELWTEAQFEGKGFSVFTSHLYEDQELHVHRELDLTAEKTWYSNDDSVAMSLELLIECKKSENPLIVLRSTRSEKPEVNVGSYFGTQDPQLFFFANNDRSAIPLPGATSHGFKLVQGFVTSDEVAHKATHTLIKSFHHWLDEHKRLLEYYVEDNHYAVAFPLLVVDCPLFELAIKPDGTPNLSRIDSAIVNQQTHLSRFPGSPFPVPIVHKDSVIPFIDAVLQFGTTQFLWLEKTPKYQIKAIYQQKSKTKSSTTSSTKTKTSVRTARVRDRSGKPAAKRGLAADSPTASLRAGTPKKRTN